MKLTAKRRLQLRKLRRDTLVHASILASAVLCAYICGKWLEALLFVIAHLALRPSFNYQFHVENTFADDAICIVTTHAMLWAIIPIIPSVRQSFLASIVFAFCTSYVGSIAQERLVLLTQKIIAFDCKRATADAILERARQKKIYDEQAEWIVDKFVKGMTYKQLCRENETEDACFKRITRIVKKLNAPS